MVRLVYPEQVRVLVVTELLQASGTAERDAALLMVDRIEAPTE